MLPSGIAGLNELRGLAGVSGSVNRATTASVGSLDSPSHVPALSNTGQLSGLNDRRPESFAGSVTWRILNGDESGIQDLYEILAEGACARLLRRVAPESREDRLHEVLVIVVEVIRSGELRDPHCLIGFIRTVTRRRVAAYIRGAIFQRRRFLADEATELLVPVRASAEVLVVERERAERVRLIIRSLRARDREILERFYFREQTPQQICADMRLTATQFRLYKSRAIARCGDRLRAVSAIRTLRPASPVSPRDRLAARIA